MARIHQISAFDSDSRVRQHELTAMRSIVATLEELGDDQARARVIRWAVETFGLSIPGPVARQPAASPTNSLLTVDPNDPTLTVDGVDEFFDPIADDDELPGDHEWRPNPKLVLPEIFPEDEWDERPPTPVALPETSNQGVVSMLHVFVADFQRLARDWDDKAESADRRIE